MSIATRRASLTAAGLSALGMLFAAPAFAQDYDDNGPYSTSSYSGSGCTYYYPSNLGANGMDHPVILWGNGTGATVSTYATGLRHWASWGFIVAAAQTTNAGTGEDMLDCLDYLESANDSSWSRFYQVVDLANVGTSGHSQGGGGSIMAAVDPRVSTSAPMQPYTTGLGHDDDSWDEQQGPMFLMSGEADYIAPITFQQYPVYLGVDVPVFWGILDGASHFEPLYSFGDYQGPSTAWFLWQLMGDSEAAELFLGSNCELCTDSDWTVYERDIN